MAQVGYVTPKLHVVIRCVAAQTRTSIIWRHKTTYGSKNSKENLQQRCVENACNVDYDKEVNKSGFEQGKEQERF